MASKYYLVVPEDTAESVEYFCKTPDEAIDQYVKDYEPMHAELVRVFGPDDGLTFELEVEEVVIRKAARRLTSG